MSLAGEIENLRREIEALARQADAELESRYMLRNLPPQQLNPYRKFRRFVGRKLREWGLRRAPPPEPWRVTLRHVPRPADAQPLLVWALGMEIRDLRTACRGLQKILAEVPGHAPVLVTDIADFAFYSRLGWLVEYVPEFPESSAGYARRKQRYVANRYRNAPAVPVTAGLRSDLSAGDLEIG